MCHWYISNMMPTRLEDYQNFKGLEVILPFEVDVCTAFL